MLIVLVIANCSFASVTHDPGFELEAGNRWSSAAGKSRYMGPRRSTEALNMAIMGSHVLLLFLFSRLTSFVTIVPWVLKF
jgi:hypothetical protein